jgi:hypothetical protein
MKTERLLGQCTVHVRPQYVQRKILEEILFKLLSIEDIDAHNFYVLFAYSEAISFENVHVITMHIL